MWNLNDYETVEERLAKYWKDYPDGRIETELLEANANRFVVMARIYRTEADSKAWTSGLAEETIAARGVNQTSALENCETSAIGRALANAGYATKGKRASREEMGKVVRQTAETIKVENPADPWVTVEKPMSTKLTGEELVELLVENHGGEVIPQCIHGSMELKEGEKNGKPWRGYVCAGKKKVLDGTPVTECPPKWMHLSKTTGKWAFNG